MKYVTILHFNGARAGRTVQAETFEAESVGEALDKAISKAARSNAGGGSIFVTGITVQEVGK
jgi:nitrogen regulatory protein PII